MTLRNMKKLSYQREIVKFNYKLKIGDKNGYRRYEVCTKFQKNN